MTTQFDVFANPSRLGKAERPYIIALQSDLIDFASRICAPLVGEQFLHPISRLNPLFEIEGKRLYLHPVEMMTVPSRLLRRPVVNLEAERFRIIAALDLVFMGI